MNKNIIVKGAKENNLKDIDLEIPRDKLVVFTGLSGSGKSSLAFDTIYPPHPTLMKEHSNSPLLTTLSMLKVSGDMLNLYQLMPDNF